MPVTPCRVGRVILPRPVVAPCHPVRAEHCHARSAPEACDPRRPVDFADFLIRDNLSRPPINLPTHAPHRTPHHPHGVHHGDGIRPREPHVRFEDPTAPRLSDRPALPSEHVRRSIEKVLQVRQPVRRGWTVDLYA
ncbi:MAG: hypothetical protein RBS39_13500 [Phycisphaerales bacterium]|nr:hypothetical protein [Phycisphaerales bacterium]